MKSRWLLALLLVIILTGAKAPAWAQTPPSGSVGIHLLETQSSGLVLDLTAPIDNFDQDLALFAIQKDTTRESDLSGGSVFPIYSVLVGLPPTGQAEFNILQDESTPVSDARLSAVYAAEPVTYSTGASARLVDEAWIRDRRVARLEFSPLQLKEGGLNATWHSQIRVEIRFSEVPAVNSSTLAAPLNSDGILDQLINSSQARDWRVSPAATGTIRDPFADAPATPLGPRYKLRVDQDGLYRLTYTDLITANPTQAAFDPHNLHMYCQGLPVAFYVAGEEDGNFDVDDYILFYGQEFRGDRLAARHPEESGYYTHFSNGWLPQYSATQVEKYTDENVYWLTVETTPGLRVASTPAVPSGAALATTFRDTQRAEQSNSWWTWSFTGEDTWFWEFIRDTKDHSYTVTLNNPDPGAGSIQVNGEMVARVHNAAVSPDHHTRILFNGQVVEDTTWDGPVRHAFSQSFPQSVAINGTNTLKVTAFYNAYSGQVTDWLCFDWFTVSYDRQFVAVADSLSFGVSPIASQRYQISGFTSSTGELWNITQPLQPARLTGTTLIGGTLEFESNLTGDQRYLAAGSSVWKAPKKIEFYTPPDLLSTTLGADYIIITHPDFVTTAQRLANFRTGQGLRTKVVNFFDLVNQFNDGIYNPIAIKNFLSYTFLHWQSPAPAYVVLIGDGHWNFKGYGPGTYSNPTQYLPPNLAWADFPDITANPDQGEVSSDNLLVNIVGVDLLPDLAVGRIPVNSTVELDAVIDKILGYEQGPLNQDWQKRVLLVADNVPDAAGEFQAVSDAIANDYVKQPFYQPVKAYLAGTDATSIAQEVNAVLAGFNSGATLVSYVGHGSINRWAGETIFSIASIASLTNGSNLPIVLSLTCSDGAWHNPTPIYTSALAEELLRAPAKGAVASFSPSGWGTTYSHDILERGFMTALFNRHVLNLGALTTAAKLNVYSNADLDLINQFTLLGDPALRVKLTLPNVYQFVPSVYR
jgi:hypothetical protein